MNKILTAFIFFLALLSPGAQGYSGSVNNPFIEAMRSMLDLFSLMQSYQQFSSQSSISTFPGQGMFSGPGQYINPYSSPWTADRLPSPYGGSGPLDGTWISNSQILLIVKNGFARIYWSRDEYQDYYLKIGPGQLLFRDAESGVVRQFDMALQQGRLALRNRQGQMTLFRKYHSGVQ